MSSSDENWKGTTWEDAELNILRAGVSLSFREKLQWLEEAERFGRTLLTCRVRYPDPDNSGGWILEERSSTHENRQISPSDGSSSES